jgi:DNA processing protein
MGHEIVSMDLLSQASGLPCDELSVILTELEMGGFLTTVPGGFLKTRR